MKRETPFLLRGLQSLFSMSKVYHRFEKTLRYSSYMDGKH